MSQRYVGCIVSLDCGDTLGTYQGQVKTINDDEQTLTICKAYRNGIQCELPEITISARDIKDLKILKSPEEAMAIVSIQSTPSKIPKDQVDGNASPVKVVSCLENAADFSIQVRLPKDRKDINSNSLWNNGMSSSGSSRTPTKEENRQRRNSASEPRRKSSTPRKIECRRKLIPREDCFSAPADSFLSEFDFEKNLALFDKKAIFQELENSLPELARSSNKKAPKYRCDENIIRSDPVVLCKIKVPSFTGHEFVTDSGLVVPSISYELRSRLFSSAERYGYSISRQMEMVGRSAAEMILQLLGGSHRLDPQNDHQLPFVVVLCGPHLQGAEGINCARHLSNHNVKIISYVPNFVKMNPALKEELRLYESSDGIKTSHIKDLPKGTVDMIVDAMDNHENTVLKEQSWYRSLVDWANQSKASVLAIDPSPDGTGGIQAKFCLSICLPLALKEQCGQVYLCDLGFPRKVFSEVGISYSSPFGHKFVIPLYVKS